VNSASNGFAYDAAGDVTNDNTHQYLYDAEGRICAESSTPVPGFTTMTGYIYDADGNRVAKGTISSWSCDPSANGFLAANNKTDYVLGPGGQPVTELAQEADGWMKWAGGPPEHFAIMKWGAPRKLCLGGNDAPLALMSSLPRRDSLHRNHLILQVIAPFPAQSR
jgi:hypothetical protein